MRKNSIDGDSPNNPFSFLTKQTKTEDWEEEKKNG
jgi:hypothetical protein